MNKLDRKPIRNTMAGRSAVPINGNTLSQPAKRNLAGFRPGNLNRPKNPLSMPTNRLGLPFRAIADGINLIESIGESLSDNQEHGYFGTIKNGALVRNYTEQVFRKSADILATVFYRKFKISASASEVAIFLDSEFGRHVADSVIEASSMKELQATLTNQAEIYVKTFKRWRTEQSKANRSQRDEESE